MPEEIEKTTATKATQTAKKVRKLVKTMTGDAHEAKAQGKPIAYCMTISRYDEILRAMDIMPVWTENYAGLCAAKRDAERFLTKAESEGYSRSICGYARGGLGFDAFRYEIGGMPPEAPDGGMAEPDVLLGSSAECDCRYKWYQALGRYLDVPTYSVDIVYPPVDADLDKVKEYYVRYQVEEFRGLVDFLERYLHRKLDYDRLSEIVNTVDSTYQLWYACDQLRMAVPCPMPSEDHFNVMVPGTFMMGTNEALDFYQELYDELKDRVKNKIGVIPDEKYRLLWGGGLPPWHTMWMFNFFESFGAVFVMENAYRGWDPVEIPGHVTDPIEHMAWRNFLQWTQWHKKASKASGVPVVERIREMVTDYKIDGVLMHGCRTCRTTTVGQTTVKNLVQEYTGKPTLQLVSDIVDLRDYSEAEWKMNIEAFIEAVSISKQQMEGG